jgi:hypothetical protein
MHCYATCVVQQGEIKFIGLNYIIVFLLLAVGFCWPKLGKDPKKKISEKRRKISLTQEYALVSYASNTGSFGTPIFF